METNSSSGTPTIATNGGHTHNLLNFIQKTTRIQHNIDTTKKWLPKRIILVRHGESMGNVDQAKREKKPTPGITANKVDTINATEPTSDGTGKKDDTIHAAEPASDGTGNKDDTIYGTVPDWSLELSDDGIEQARKAGKDIVELLAKPNPEKKDWKVFFYVSPYVRTRATLREIGRSVPKDNLIGVKEECRIREQDFGNFQDKKMKYYKKKREEFSRFYYRFPEGESGSDIYDRICGFLETLWRDLELQRFPHDPEKEELNLVLVCHGLTIRIFLMNWFGWTVDQYNQLRSPKNCEYRILELGAGDEYSLTINHSDKTLAEDWGLSPEMIQDQKNRQFGKDLKFEEAEA